MNLATVADFVLLAAIWGSSFLFTRLAVLDFGVLPTAALRVAIAAAVLLPLMLWRGLGPQFRARWKTICLIGLLNSGIPFALFSFALLAISTGLSGILNATAPLFGALVAWAWLKDRPTGSQALGLALGFGGVALLSWDKASFQPGAGGIAPAWAVLACLGATLCYGLGASAVKRYLQGVPPLAAAAGSQLGAALGLALPALWLWPAAPPGWGATAAVLVAGILCTGIAYILYFRLMEQAGPTRTIAVTFLIPVFALGYGALFLHEEVTPWMVACGLVIVAGTMLSTGLVALPSARRRRLKSGLKPD